jgi:hypothetical protein
MTGDSLSDYLDAVMPIPPDDEEHGSKVGERHDRIQELFFDGDGNDLPGIRESLFAAYNAITQWVDRESYTPRHREPLRSIWFGNGARLKQRAFAVAGNLAASWP